jgi:hypothetical protein
MSGGFEVLMSGSDTEIRDNAILIQVTAHVSQWWGSYRKGIVGYETGRSSMFRLQHSRFGRVGYQRGVGQ